MNRAIFSTVTFFIICFLLQGTALATGGSWGHHHSNTPRVHNLADILKSGEIIGEVNFCGAQGTNGSVVDLVGESFSVVLGANGTFKLRYVPRGAYTLRVSIPGQPEHTQAVTVKKRQVTDVGGISICPDNDDDGFTLADDCNDNNGAIFPGAEELCDGVDNDCDGAVDGPGCDCTDADNDSFFAQEGCGTAVDCNDDSDTINPSAVEICDGVDNNCDNAVDEGFDLNTDLNNCGACSTVCSGSCQGGVCFAICGNGVVEEGEECDDGNQDNNDACPDGAGATCQDATCGDGHVHIAGGEECDDGNTTDGDGCQADCTLPVPVTCSDGTPSGETRPCDGSDSDFCVNGTQTCIDGEFTACEESITDIIEVCNGIDDNCDGQIDENFPDLGQSCISGVGLCEREGVLVCSNSGADTTCSATPGAPQAEACNGVDDNCDGQTDEGDELCGAFACGGPAGCFNICNPNGGPGSDSFCAPGHHCEDTTQDDSFCVPDVAPVCGNGVVEAGEQCDDGNNIDGDGCQANCTATINGTGTFNIQPAATYVCGAIQNPVEFDLNVQTFSFQDLGAPLIQVAGAPSGPTMSGSIDPTGSFVVTAVIPGGVNEHFTLVGQFSDPDNWTGTFSVSFSGVQLPISNCSGQSWSVTGTR